MTKQAPITFYNKGKTRFVYEYNQYNFKQTNPDKTRSYKCSVSHCYVSMKLDPNNFINKLPQEEKHVHLPMTEIEVDVFLKTALLRDKVEVNQLNMDEAKKEYEAVYVDLLTRYDAKNLAPFWRSWEAAKSTYRYRTKKAKEMRTIETSKDQRN